MGKNSAKGIKRVIAGCLTLALLISGCSKLETEPTAEPTAVQSFPVETENPEVELERLSAQKAAEEKLSSYLWPQESVQKNIMGEDMEFTLYHGNGWTMDVPTSWEEEKDYSGQWEAPSHCASFSVDKHFLGVNNPKWYRAQVGSWRHETSYAPPFDYYYDNDGGYTPPEGSADYIYFFAPDGERRSYELTLQTIVGETSEEEMRIQEAMLLSFNLDESSRVLKSEEYTPGETEWEAAMAGLMAEAEPIWFRYDGGTSIETGGKGKPEYVSYALALEEFCPEEFTQMFFGEKPQGAEELTGQPITLCLLEMRIWLYFYDNSPWVQISHAGEDYWARVYHKQDPDKVIFDAVRTWMEAESAWATGSTGH